METSSNRKRRQKKVTSIDVAREAGVSQATVSLVLNRTKGVSFNPDTVERVRKAAERLQYRPNVAARSITTRKAYSIGLISRWDAGSPFFTRTLRGILPATRDAGYALTLCDVEVDVSVVESAVDRAIGFYREGRIDGIIAILATLQQSVLPVIMLQRLQEEHIPLVIVNSPGNDPTLDEVCTDNVHAGYLGTRHLIDLGHRRIGFFVQRTGRKQTTTADTDRLKGYRKALREAGLGAGDELVIQVPDAPVSFDAGYKTFRNLLRSGMKPPSALYAINDFLALGAMLAAQDEGLRIPEDLAIVGTDDYTMSPAIRPTLTSVRQPLKQMGQEAVRILLERIDERAPSDPVKLSLPCELVVRQSCGGGAQATSPRLPG